MGSAEDGKRSIFLGIRKKVGVGRCCAADIARGSLSFAGVAGVYVSRSEYDGGRAGV